MTGPERSALQSDWLRAARRDRDQAILSANAAGLTAEAIARAFGLSCMTVTRIVRSGNRGTRSESHRRAARTFSTREGRR